MERSLADIRNIHGHLGNAVFIYEPADGLGPRQSSGNHDRLAVLIHQRLAGQFTAFTGRAPFFPDVKSNGIGAARTGGVEIEVDRNEEVTCTHGSCTRTCHLAVKSSGAIIRSFSRIIHAGRKPLILTPATDSQVLTLLFQRGSLISITGNFKL